MMDGICSAGLECRTVDAATQKTCEIVAQNTVTITTVGDKTMTTKSMVCIVVNFMFEIDVFFAAGQSNENTQSATATSLLGTVGYVFAAIVFAIVLRE
jgi:hypothetical protein